MGKTYRGYDNHRDKSEKKGGDRKRFVREGEGHLTAAQGGNGNKRGWDNHATIWKHMDRGQYQKYLDKDLDSD